MTKAVPASSGKDIPSAAPKRTRGPSPARTQATAARILASARGLFYAKGYDDTSVEDIAAGSGVSRAAIYKHFPTKDGILLALLRDDLALQRAEYAELARIERLTRSAVKSWLRRFRAGMDERRGSLSLFNASRALVPEIRGDVTGHRDTAIAALGARFKGFDLDALDRPSRAVQRVKCYLMLFMIEESAVTFSTAPGTPDLAIGQDMLADALLAFLRTGEIRVG